jgi:YfiH family protein
VRRAIGAVHSSWQGTVAHATTQMVRVMQQAFGSSPDDLLAGIAPCAGPCCYEVGQDVRRIARTKLENSDQFFHEHCPGRTTFNLWAANRQQLLDSEVQSENIELAGLCSICDTRFWSHRRDGATAGRSALFISLR